MEKRHKSIAFMIALIVIFSMLPMYAYQKKYTSENVTLLYPLTEKVEQDKDIRFLSHDGTEIKVRFVDLFDLSNSLRAIVEEIRENE